MISHLIPFKHLQLTFIFKNGWNVKIKSKLHVNEETIKYFLLKVICV